MAEKHTNREGGTMQAVGWVFIGVLVLLVLFGLFMAVGSLPELARYRKIKSM